MEMHCTIKIACRNMQSFIFAASYEVNSHKCDYFRCKKLGLQGKPRPLNECPACLAVIPHVAVFESGAEPHVFDLD